MVKPHQQAAKEKARTLSFNVTPELEKFIFQAAKATGEKPATVIREILEHAMRGEIVIRKRA
jgi:predicted DNA-binding protein